MVSKLFIITAETGLHARPATQLVQEASKYASKISLKYGSTIVNLKSIMGVMSLAVGKGGHITISATGSDENKALTGIEKRLKDNALI